MKILLVIDQFDQGNNGTTISASVCPGAGGGWKRGVRCADGKPARGKYPMPEIHFLPVADSIIRSQGMVFAKPKPQRAGAGDRMGGRGAFYDALCAFPCRTADCKGNGQTGDSGVPCAAGKHYIDDSSWEK